MKYVAGATCGSRGGQVSLPDYMHARTPTERNQLFSFMRYTSKYHKKQRTVQLAAWLFFFVLSALLFPSFIPFHEPAENRYKIFLYGEEMGVLAKKGKAEELLLEAKRVKASESKDLYMVDNPAMEIEADAVIFGKADTEEQVFDNMVEALSKHEKETLKRAYTVKVNTQVVNLANSDCVNRLLSETIGPYDPKHKYSVWLKQDSGRVLKALTPNIGFEQTEVEAFSPAAGIETIMEETTRQGNELASQTFYNYELGLVDLKFSEDIEVAEAYLPESQLTTVENALDILTKEQEVQQIYEVKSGDTLSEISLAVNIPMEQIVEMNSDYMESINSTIHVGQSLIITVPKPELSVLWISREHYEEIYEEEVVYIDNDDWYTTQKVTITEPSAGFREVVADIHYENDKEVSRDVLKEVVIKEAVAKVVERGTKIPPTYVKPISGGRLSSGFGKRKAPKKGASTYHKGVDWATPVGTPVKASCGGKVVKAGWGSGYGYVVYISHPDGKQTRYGHLSKIYVKEGQEVSQNDKIALSGNTGISTGPHLHFEILVNGVQVNPFTYLN